jgi:hypothetical protein
MSVLHMVIFAPKVPRKAIDAVQSDLLAARAAHEISFESARLSRRVSMAALDGRYGGSIKTGVQAGEYVLVISLRNTDALRAYYEAPAHSAIRRRFLCSISEEIAPIYERADADPCLAAQHYEAVEELAAEYMSRFDLCLLEDRPRYREGDR